MEVPLIYLNCLASISPSIASFTHFFITCSNTLAATGLSEIGKMSLSTQRGFDFGNGITLAVFHSIGNTHSLTSKICVEVMINLYEHYMRWRIEYIIMYVSSRGI